MSTTATLPPVTRQFAETFIGGPDSGRTRRECWAATTKDGRWDIRRSEHVGTPWDVTDIETGLVVGEWFGTLKAARQFIADGRADKALEERKVEVLVRVLVAPVRRMTQRQIQLATWRIFELMSISVPLSPVQVDVLVYRIGQKSERKNTCQ